MKLSIEGMLEEETRLAERLRVVKDSIRALRKLCGHQWEKIGHDSHHDCFRCSVCGEEDWR